MTFAKFAAEARRGIALLGGEPTEKVVDFFLDPTGAAAALSALGADDGIVVRMFPPAPASTTEGATPVDPVWVRLSGGMREIGTATLRGEDGYVRRASRVRLEEQESACCDAPSCERRRKLARVQVVLEGMGKGAPDEVLTAFEQAVQGTSPDLARTMASRLAQALGVALEPADTVGAPASVGAADDLELDLGRGADMAELARYVQRIEGDRMVFGILASAGPGLRPR